MSDRIEAVIWGLSVGPEGQVPVPQAWPLKVFIPGLPRPQGSMQPIVSRSTGRAFMKQSPALHEWRGHVMTQVREAMSEQAWAGVEKDTPVALDVTFYFDRPKSHSKKQAGRDKGLKSNGSDLDKLVRAIGDSLQFAGAIHDDRQIATLMAKKRYAGHSDDQGVQLMLYRY